MIELLLQAERSLAMGLVDQAERLYRQAADADPRNSIAVVGLARVALERADDAEAWRQAQRALAIDPENAAARRLVERLEEVFAHRGQPLPEPVPDGASALAPAAAGVATEVAQVAPAVETTPAVEPAPDPRPAAAVAPGPRPAAHRPPATRPTTSAPRRGLVDRLLGRKRT